MSRKFNAGYYVSEGFHSIFTHGFMSFAAVCMIVACLLIMGSFTLLAVNLDNTLGDLENENEMLVYIDDALTQDQARMLQPKLAQVDNVAQLTFVTKEAAVAAFKAKHSDTTAILNNLPDDAFRDRYRVHVVDIERMAETKAALEQMEGVGYVNAATEIADGFVMVRNIATGVALVLIGILLVISLFIIANTIKLATFYRREEIAIMKMCGATDGFIEWPFVVEGMLLGLTGALIAFFVQWGLYQMVARFAVQGNGLSLVNMISYGSMAVTILAVFCGVGVFIGVVGSLFAIRKFLQV
ncbi:MAG: ABC transporter permease [Lawsonibacter sp.]|jgi:cell division transport system permease protein|uniref:permease-like cell division protein FtsX n=1 Tax=Lawsonibacter sp. JLR.KK007 TaxID=3114293 RepID=UPI00216F597C|nr:ABC transporter permease [Lawsonibacter sp.]MCI8989887.1 ABC transporter permease [Lawsonibacter sp.]MCI9269283.1 ABC transporter permease [Lawsonibacter sp.]